MENVKFVGSGSPHVKNNSSTRKIMLDVVIALCPSFIAGIVFFGARTILVVLLAILSSFVSEVIYSLCCKKTFKEAINTDFSSVVTGFIIGLSLNVKTAWYVPVFAGIFAVVVVKMLFGGTGCNVVNPAAAGRAFVFISFIALASSNINNGWITPDGNVIVGATPITSALEDGLSALGVTNLDLFLGTNLAGCIGETCKVAIIIGYIYLVARRVIDFKWPLVYLAVAGLFTVMLKGFDFSWFLPSILSGGLMFVAVFMATDYVTTPNTTLGNLIYFVALGLITAGLRVACKVEVVTFALLLMNIVVPLIDKWIIPKPFGSTQSGEAQTDKKEGAKQ